MMAVHPVRLIVVMNVRENHRCAKDKLNTITVEMESLEIFKNVMIRISRMMMDVQVNVRLKMDGNAQVESYHFVKRNL